MRRKNFLVVGVALLCATVSVAGVPQNIGSMIGKNVALYADHTRNDVDLATERDVTADYKIVTFEGKSYAYLKVSNGLVAGTPWAMQLRYYEGGAGTVFGPIENNLENDKSYGYATGVSTKPLPDPLYKISFFAVAVEAGENSETDFIDYDIKRHNSLDESNQTVPVITNATAVASFISAEITIEGDDTDVFYYIEDQANEYSAIAMVKNVVLTGLKSSTVYRLTITPVHMISGKEGAPNVLEMTTKTDITDITVPVTASTFNFAEAGTPTFEDVTDDEQEQVLHVKAMTGAAWAMIQANKPLPEGLGEGGKEFSYAHVIVKCAKDGQVVRGGFSGEVAMMNPFLPKDQWQDAVFSLGKRKINEIVIYLDYYGDGQGGEFPKELWVKEVVFNDSPDPLIGMAQDTEKPKLNSVSIVEGGIAYSSIKMNVSATDNIAVASYVVKDAEHNFDKELTAKDGVIFVNGLVPATTYNFTVQAKDAAGNLSDATELDPVATITRLSDCSGDFAHFPIPNGKKIHYEISHHEGVTTFTINPIDENRTLDFAQILIKDKDGNSMAQYVGMPIADGGKSATFTGTYEQHEVYIVFVYSLDDMPGNEQSAETNAAFIVDMDKAVFYIIGDCASALEKRGTDTDPVLIGAWSEETFDGYNLDYTKLTTLDLTGVSGITVLPVMADLNPNCLIYVNKNTEITDDAKNIVSFDMGVGTADKVVLQEGNNFNNTREFTATTISYTRDFTSMNGWASVCLPFMAETNGLTVEEFIKATAAEEQTTLTFTPIMGAIEANTPYIIKVGAETGNKEFASTETVIPVTPEEIKVTHDGFDFVGNYELIPEGGATGFYLLQTDGTAMAKGVQASTVPAFRSYLKDMASPNSVKYLSIAHENGTTGMDTQENQNRLTIISGEGLIEIISGEKQTLDLYSIDGRIVKRLDLNEGYNVCANLAKGIYIVKNQKVIVK